MEWTRRTIAITAIAAVLVIVLVAAVGAAVYFEVGYGPDEAALSAVDDDVTVERLDGSTAVRTGPVTNETTGLIYYPGARVNHESYVPTAAEMVTDRDIVVVILQMPLNLAILDVDGGDDAIAQYPPVESWYVGGHSLGGAMACRYAHDNANELDGVVLHAAYCDRDLSGTELRALSVLGEDDGVLDVETERERRALLPSETTVVEVEGLNHAGFGAYGQQRGDAPAPRPPEAMRTDVAETTARWLLEDSEDI